MGSLVQEQVPPLARLIRSKRDVAEALRGKARVAEDPDEQRADERLAEYREHEVRRLTRRIFEGMVKR